MMREVVYGLGGYCENCDETHDHPLHNLIEVIEVPDEEVGESVPLLAAALQEALSEIEDLKTRLTTLEG